MSMPPPSDRLDKYKSTLWYLSRSKTQDRSNTPAASAASRCSSGASSHLVSVMKEDSIAGSECGRNGGRSHALSTLPLQLPCRHSRCRSGANTPFGGYRLKCLKLL